MQGKWAKFIKKKQLANVQIDIFVANFYNPTVIKSKLVVSSEL